MHSILFNTKSQSYYIIQELPIDHQVGNSGGPLVNLVSFFSKYFNMDLQSLKIEKKMIDWYINHLIKLNIS